MKTIRFFFRITAAFMLLTLISACKKGFLEAKPNQDRLLPKTLADYQALLDNFRIFVSNSAPGLPHVASDDFVITDAGLQNLSLQEKGAYLWQRDMEPAESDWANPYFQVFYCNVVLEGLETLPGTERETKTFAELRGSALFLRSNAFLFLLQSFSKPYNKETAATDLGIPLKVSADVNERKERATVQASYDRIVSDIRDALQLLPAATSYKSRPSKAAAYALLSRIYLSMGDFSNALKAAEEALSLNRELINYNTLPENAVRTFPRALPNSNPEIIFYSEMANYIFNLSALTGVNPELYNRYSSSDRRKKLFFADRNGVMTFKGSYSGTDQLFAGLTTSELYLTRAECLARAGRITEGLAELNALLRKRYDASFSDLSISDQGQLLQTILLERRKELVGRGLRWFDLRRLNREPALAETLSRTVNGQTITLPPNDNRYTFLISRLELASNPIPQNER